MSGGSAPEIPGFQPLHIRGGGDLGIWIEARQVRLDRKVLLKVLPASEAHLEEEFSREVRCMVELDGTGVLRVIDEGRAGSARYVALDEAGGKRLSPGDLDEAEARSLVLDMYRLFRKSASKGWLPGQIPVESIRSLPGGVFAVTELGRIQKNSTPSDGQKKLIESLRRWGRHLEIYDVISPMIEELRSASGADGRWPENWDRASGAVDSPAHKVGPFNYLLMSFIVLALALGVWWSSTNDMTRETPEEGFSHSNSGSTGETRESERGEDSRSKTPLDSEDLLVGEVDSRDVDSDIEIVQPTSEEETLTLYTWSEQEKKRELNLLRWLEQRSEFLEVLTGSGAGLAEAVQMLEELERDPDHLLSLEKDHEIHALIMALKYQYQLHAGEILRGAREYVASDDHQQATQLLRQGIAQLGSSDLLQESLDHVESLLQQKEEVSGLLDEGFLRVLRNCLANPLNVDLTISVPGIENFSALLERQTVFLAEVEEVLHVHSKIVSMLSMLESDRGYVSLGMGLEKSLEVRVDELDSTGMRVTRRGRRDSEKLEWNQLSAETRKRLFRDADPAGFAENPDRWQQLSVLWDGESGWLSHSDLTSFQVIPEVLDRFVLRRKIEDLEKARNLEAVGDRSSLQLWVSQMVEKFPVEIWSPEEKFQLEKWWSLQLGDRGLENWDIFGGAEMTGWAKTDSFREIELSWSDGEKILLDWIPGDESQVRLLGRSEVVLSGSARLNSPLEFVDALEVSIVGAVTMRERPNLNIVLWLDRAPLLFGAGIRPQGRSSFTSSGETVLLPAHGIMPLEGLEIRDSKKGEDPLPFPLPVMSPRLNPGNVIQMVASDSREGAKLSLNGREILDYSAKKAERSGGVGIETFGSSVVIRSISLKGRWDEASWNQFLLKKASSALWMDK